MTTVRLTKARTFELDPNKKYLIQVKEGALSKEGIYILLSELKEIGIKNAVVVRLPKNQHLKIVEAV